MEIITPNIIQEIYHIWTGNMALLFIPINPTFYLLRESKKKKKKHLNLPNCLCIYEM